MRINPQQINIKRQREFVGDHEVAVARRECRAHASFSNCSSIGCTVAGLSVKYSPMLGWMGSGLPEG